MSLRYEQYRALQSARDFLRDLLCADTRPRTVREIKRRALACLRHYPMLAEDGRPIFSRDAITNARKTRREGEQ